MTGVEFRMLGPLEVLRDGTPLDLGPGRPRSLLAYLLVHANQVVTADRLIEDLWHGSPPASAGHAVQVYVSNLRRLLEPDRRRGAAPQVLVSRTPGYVLVADRDSCDAQRFVALVAEGQAALDQGQVEEAAAILRNALGLWRGPALADLAEEPWAVAEAVRLEELRMAITERRVEADLALGRHRELVSELESLVALHPFRERLWAQLMLALYRSGRQTEALRSYQRARTLLGEELGLEPGPELRELEARVLGQDPALGMPVLEPAPRATVDDSPLHATIELAADPPDDSVAVEEVRIVTALVADLAGSASLAERLDPEEQLLVVKGATDRMARCVEGLGGTVVDRSGAGITALFGTPVAHEDDTQRAVLAGLDIVAELDVYGEEVARSWGVALLRARVGIDTGPVLVEPNADAVGEAGSTAALLGGAARAGSVLASRAVQRLVQPLFEWEEVGQPAPTGNDQVIEAVEVRAARSTSGKPRGLGGRAVPLVGRDRELSEAGQSVDAVLAGTGGVLLVTAEAGLGKSRLLAELRRRFEGGVSAGGRPLWLEGRCLSWGQSLAYWPFRELLRDWLGASPTHPALRTRVSLQRRVDELFGSDAAEAAAVLGDLLGLPLEPEAAALLSSMPRESMRPAVFGMIQSLLERLAARGPVTVALDDVHWADTTSLAVIEHLLSLQDASPILTIIAMRPERDHAAWRVREAALRQPPQRTREVVLAPLTDDVDARLLDALVGPGVLPPHVAQNLREVADGNPLFLEELVRSLLEHGALVADQGGWTFQRAVPIQLPGTIEQVLSSRIDRVPARSRAVLAAAAVLGRQFDTDVLSSICGAETDVDTALGDLEHSDLLRQVRRWPSPEYRFSHPLIAEAAYRRLAEDRRRTLHRRAANAIETLFPDRQAENYAVLAFHYERAGQAESALAYHHRAGDEARAAHALNEALVHYSAAIELLDAVPPAAGSRVRPALHLGRGYAWWQLADRRAGSELRHALSVARAVGDTGTELQALELLSVVEGLAEGDAPLAFARLDQALQVALDTGDIEAEVAVRNRLTVALANRLDLGRASETGEAALASALRSGDERLVARAMDGLKLVAFVLGDFSALESRAAELEAVLRRGNDRRYLQYVLAESSFASASRGDWEGARHRLAEAEGMNEELGNRFDRPYLLTLRAWLDRTQGEYGRALRGAREAATAARQQENAQWVAWAEANLGAILLELGGAAEALDHLHAARVAAERGSMHIQLVRALAHAALARLRLGDAPPDEELGLAERLLHEATTPDDWTERVVLYELDAYVAVATVRAARGEVDAATALLRPVLDAAERVGWIEGAARAGLVLAKCAASARDLDGARALFARALELAHERLPPVEWQVRAGHAQLLSLAGHNDGAEAERRLARSIVLQLAASLGEPELGSRFTEQALTVLARPALDLWP